MPRPIHAALVALLCCLSGLAFAQPYPNRPITLVVPFPPGGAADVIGRAIARGLEKQLKNPVVVENRAGAGTSVAAAHVANAKPDGYTLLSSTATTYVLNAALKDSLPYDPLKSFEAIGLAGSLSLMLIAHPSVPFPSLKELIAAAKAQPGKLSYASFGSGTSSHFAGELFKFTTGVDITHVPYKGSAPAMQDLIGGQVLYSMDTTLAAAPQIKAGKIKGYAVASAKRSPQLPDVPTFAELGLPEMQMQVWSAMVAPRGLPPEVREALTRAFAAMMADPEVTSVFVKAGLDVLYEPPAAYARYVERELPLMRALVQKAKMQAD